MQCTNCGAQNEEGYRFCMKCGSALVATAPPEPVEPVYANPPEELVQTAPVQPPAPVYVPPLQTVQATPPPVQTQYPPQTPRTYPVQQAPAPAYNQYAPYGATATSLLGIWRPFAGYGTRRRHTGWLMDNQGERAKDLSDRVTMKFSERVIPGAQVERKTLVGRGVIVENRPYFLVQRGLVTVGLYVVQFGKDLFVSLASYLKPPISNLRLVILGLMSLFALYTLFVFPGSLNNAFMEILGSLNFFGEGATPSGPSLGSLLCIVGPLGTLNLLALALFVIYSLYKLVTEKDILAGLRVSPNEFNEDDLMAMEKAIEQTVRISLDEIGLNADDLKPVAVEAGQRLI
jgi:hypothetical protein